MDMALASPIAPPVALYPPGGTVADPSLGKVAVCTGGTSFRKNEDSDACLY